MSKIYNGQCVKARKAGRDNAKQQVWMKEESRRDLCVLSLKSWDRRADKTVRPRRVPFSHALQKRYTITARVR